MSLSWAPVRIWPIRILVLGSGGIAGGTAVVLSRAGHVVNAEIGHQICQSTPAGAVSPSRPYWIVRMAASAAGGGMYISGGNTTVSDCQIWGNTPDQIFGPFTDDGGNVMGLYCPPPTSPCPSDISGDGEVGPLDLALLLGNWGLCP